MDHNHLTIKTFMAITAERDAAIRERNMALEERKRAFAERDMALLQRDAAIAERNSALQERDEAIASFRLRDNSMNDNNTLPATLEEELARDEHLQHQNQMGISDTAYVTRQDSVADEFNTTGVNETSKRRKGRQSKDGKPVKFAKTSRVGKRSAEELSNPVDSALTNGWNKGRDLECNKENPVKQVSWKDNQGLNQINFDESSMPVPVCTCTGAPQPCYRWGSGGWQSACCTTTISMYPLPQAANRRYSRVGGRKMSGSAFSKLINRLAAEGHDFSTPLDLRYHWAKHGTNRYSTLK